MIEFGRLNDENNNKKINTTDDKNQIGGGEENDIDDEIKKLMVEDYSYPSPSHENFQEAIYTKREFYINAIPARKKITPENRLQQYRKLCNPNFSLSPTQVLLSNFINPSTPYRGVLINHGTGVGKTCAAVAIAEKFKSMVEKYGTRIHVLVPGPINKQNFMKEVLKCTGETYFKYFIDKTTILNEAEMNKNKKNAYNIINRYYRFMSYRSFYKKVLGEKIREKNLVNNKVKISNRKNSSGQVERELSFDRIYNLNNTLLIVDEAHNVTGNEYGDSIRKIINVSTNLRVVLLTATPMKNLADDFVELINFLRPKNYPMERDKIFTSQRNHLMEFKPTGKEYLRKMIRGYISYLRGADPLTFAERIDMGVIPPGLNFTKVIRCYMLPFQLEIYKEVIETLDDSLDRSSEAVSNFAFPALSKNGKKIVGYYGIEGMNEVKNQLKSNSGNICKKLATEVLSQHKIKDPSSLIYLADNGKQIRGDIYKEEYLKNFSIKFYTALQKINETVYGNRGEGLLFVYSNLVRSGIEIFQEVLQHNGYLEFQEEMANYNINKNTRCYFCGYDFEHHDEKMHNHKVPTHDFYPSTYITVTGKSEENNEQIPEEKHRILDTIFNNKKNKNGKFIKIVIGSKVMNEGITLKNIKEIHILDVHFSLGKVDQVIGRGIRYCTHQDVVNEDGTLPKVEIYKYVVSLKGEMSSEEKLYKNAEQKYRLVKETERIFHEEALDCPLNRNGNIFEEELIKYKDCGTKNNPCPAICGYLPCEFTCGDKALNNKYYDPSSGLYKKLKKSQIDYSTYNTSLASEEIEYAKSKIKDMYRLNHVYELGDFIKYVKKSFPLDKRDMFDDFYVYQALDELIPITSNDFNNYHDIITDKYNRPGYLIYRDKYYIFQLFDENEDLPMYYRRNYRPLINNRFNLKNYIKNIPEYIDFKSANVVKKAEENTDIRMYDFVSGQDYYDNRPEFEYVGAIDQEPVKKKKISESHDTFKIRNSRPKVIEKKRQAGIPSYRGAVCSTSKDREYLENLMEKLNLIVSYSYTRTDLCNIIRDKMYDMEKYATTKDGNKMTYLIVPTNHPTIPFPLNLEDRIKHIINDLRKETRIAVTAEIDVIPIKNSKFDDIKYVSYTLQFDSSMDQFADLMNKYNATKVDNKWIIKVE